MALLRFQHDGVQAEAAVVCLTDAVAAGCCQLCPFACGNFDVVVDLMLQNKSRTWRRLSCFTIPPPPVLPHLCSFDLVVDLTLQNTWGPNHPGIRLLPSSAGTTLTA